MSCPWNDPTKKCFILGSYPRSGNTMIRNCLEHYFRIQAWGDGPHVSARLVLSGALGLEKYPDASIHAEKSHVPRRDDHRRALILVRDPRDVAVSYAHFDRDVLELGHTPHERRLQAHCQNEGWSTFYSFWLHERQENGGVEFIKYEDCVRHITHGTIVDYLQLALLGLGITTPVQNSKKLPSFKEYQKARPKFYRRGVAGAWRDELPPPLAELCWKKHGPVARKFGYLKCLTKAPPSLQLDSKV